MRAGGAALLALVLARAFAGRLVRLAVIRLAAAGAARLRRRSTRDRAASASRAEGHGVARAVVELCRYAVGVQRVGAVPL